MTDPVKIPSQVYINATAAAFDVMPADIFGDRRTAVVARARFAACVLLRKHRKSAYKAIARFLNNRDHSTIIAAVRRGEALLAHDQHFITRFEAAERDALSWVYRAPGTVKAGPPAREQAVSQKSQLAVNFEALESHEPDNIENKMLRESIARASFQLGRLLRMEGADQ